ncbi:hypothetical protein [Nocardia arthritidis]|uniref:LLM class flavin-dependent oxidoreductase n=1 Tax=Nocardia arthritidis TaxID=228602 RepID=A0A6G9YPS4_9NOCA|nr:hypothetical protein [Nocardia arthritidis]QIS15299.1 hypothetical protein F5544_37360 [Nocardia arthritidis]
MTSLGAVFRPQNPPELLREVVQVADSTGLELVEKGRAASEYRGEFSFVVQLLTATGPDATDRVTTELRRMGHDTIDGLSAVGDAHAVADAVARWVQAGADTVVLEPTPDEPDPAGFVRFAGEQVRPLIA